MKSGICPKCGSNNIHTNTDLHYFGKPGAFGGNSIQISTFRWNGGTATLDSYICVDCGFLESYVHKDKKRKTIAEKWPKVESG